MSSCIHAQLEPLSAACTCDAEVIDCPRTRFAHLKRAVHTYQAFSLSVDFSSCVDVETQGCQG